MRTGGLESCVPGYIATGNVQNEAEMNIIKHYSFRICSINNYLTVILPFTIKTSLYPLFSNFCFTE